jgi:hypothetical protein
MEQGAPALRTNNGVLARLGQLRMQLREGGFANGPRSAMALRC